MNKEMKDNLGKVINSLVNDDSKTATDALHEYLRAKAQTIILGEMDEECDDAPVKGDSAEDDDEMNASAEGDEDLDDGDDGEVGENDEDEDDHADMDMEEEEKSKKKKK